MEAVHSTTARALDPRKYHGLARSFGERTAPSFCPPSTLPETLMLAILFAHLGIADHLEHDGPELENNLRLSLAGFNSVLEIGGFRRPFLRFLAPYLPSRATLYGFGLDKTHLQTDRNFVSRQGQFEYIGSAFPETKFDLIVSVGVFCIGGLATPECFAQGKYSSLITEDLIERFSENPKAAFLASSWEGPRDDLVYDRGEVERFSNIQFWHNYFEHRPYNRQASHVLLRRKV